MQRFKYQQLCSFSLCPSLSSPLSSVLTSLSVNPSIHLAHKCFYWTLDVRWRARFFSGVMKGIVYKTMSWFLNLESTSKSKGWVDAVTIMNSWVKAAVRIVWLLQTYGVPKSEIDRKLTKFLLDLYKHKISRVSEKNLTWFIKTKSQQLLNQFPDGRQFTDPEPVESRRLGPLEEGPQYTTKTVYC